MDNDLALKIYIKARATPKVVAAFAERGEFDKILIYCKQVKTFVFIHNIEIKVHAVYMNFSMLLPKYYAHIHCSRFWI